MYRPTILWADDEIDILRPHILFLQNKGYDVETVDNGSDAVRLAKEKHFDIVFLDEQMPGISGVEALEMIKRDFPNLPIVMITKSEEERIMEDAIGSNIADYLIKPVNPNQILLSLKRILDNQKLSNEKSTSKYQQEFRQIGIDINNNPDFAQWCLIYKNLVRWELELEKSSDQSIKEILASQKNEANTQFTRFIERNYVDWIQGRSNSKPTMSHTLVRDKVLPLIDSNDKPVFFIMIDNLRYDQWKAIQPLIEKYFHVVTDDIYCSILPTSTQYARNSIFAGLMPNQIAQLFPDLWVDEDEEEGKNLNEAPLIRTHIERYRRHDTFSYTKVNNAADGEKLVAQFKTLQQNDLNVIVVNFIDMLSHARTESKMVRELASDENAYRSITTSWFLHSPIRELFRLLADTDARIIITTDHGSIRVNNPVKVVGDKNTNTNLRYKLGKNLSYNPKEVFELRDPRRAFLPSPNISTAYIFAQNDDFFAYPNNYNYYASYYRNTFQHGGISLEEMLIPLISMQSKRRK